MTCCGKPGEGNEIVRAQPVGFQEFPGLLTSDKLAKQKEKPAQDNPCLYQVPEPILDQKEEPEPAQDSFGLYKILEVPPDQNEDDVEETYDDGSTYVGQIVGGQRHGHGVRTSADEQYSGQWKHGHRDGQGRQTWQDGRVFEGQFREGKLEGRGRMEWHMPKGLLVYEGEYVNDLKEGQGKYIWPDGRMYDGEWYQGKRSGKATFVNSAGERRESIWNDDKLERWCDQDEGQA